MGSDAPDLPLASVFPAAIEPQWRALVEGVLRGSDFDRKLVGRTYDGIRVEPLYAKSDAAPVAIGAAKPWRIAARVDHPNPAEAASLALTDLEGGADALVLAFVGTRAARGFGLPGFDTAVLDAALRGTMLDLVSVRLDAGRNGRRAALAFADLAKGRGHEPATLAVDFACDPIGAMAGDGDLELAWADTAERLAEVAGDLRSRGFAGPFCIADGRPYHEAGGGEAQELGAVLATALAYLRALEAGGFSLEASEKALSFLLVADADEFLTVAKFRALRRLWASVQEACNVPLRRISLHAETAWRNATRRDPWVNMLRGTVAGFSAAIGGADSLLVQPFTVALGLPDAFARRVARNTQLILAEESNLWRVADPVAGSGGFEALTDALVEEGWAAFQLIEREGGIVASLTAGHLQRRIAEVRAAREKAVATRRDPLTGTSEFPHLGETAVSVLLPAMPTTMPTPTRDPTGAVRIEPLPARRLAEPFERLRDRSDRMLAATGKRPRVFLANLGALAAFSARATFARNVFEAGGIEAITNDGFASEAELVAAFRASGARLACLCSSDAIYADEAVATAAALRDAGAAALYLTGRPGALEAALAELGLTRFVFSGCDLVALLDEAVELAS